jgi:hypothetical protein
MVAYLFYFFLAYLLYRLVFNFILPVYRTTRQVKKGFRDMQERMNGNMGQPNAPHKNSNSKKSSNPKVGDYIDFEEVKE